MRSLGLFLRAGGCAAALVLVISACDDSTGAPTDADLGATDLGPGIDSEAGTDAKRPDGLVHGIIGRFSALAAHGGKLMASGYEKNFGDLVLTTVSVGDLTGLTEEIVDGVPKSPPTKDPGGWRGGVSQAGDDVGQDTDIVVDGSGAPMIAYRDITALSLKYARRSGGAWTSHTVDKPKASTREIVGRYGSMVLNGGKPAIAYLALNVGPKNSAFSSQLRWAEATSASPSGPSDWTVTVVEENPMPCRNLCQSGELCVLAADGTSTCKPEDSGCSSCASGTGCVGGKCVPVLADSKVVDVPVATGLWPAATVVSGTPLVVYYDRMKGRLKAATRSGGSWKTAVVRSGTGADRVGAFCDVAVEAGGTVHVAYQNEAKATLHYLQLDPATLKGSADETIDNGMRVDGQHPVGGDVAIVIGPAGKPRVAYQDAQTSDLLAAVRTSPGTWTPNTSTDASLGRLLLGGPKGYGFYSGLVLEGGKLYGSTLAYDQQAKPKGGLVFFEVK